MTALHHLDILDEQQMAKSPPLSPVYSDYKYNPTSIESPPAPPPLDDPCWLLDELDLNCHALDASKTVNRELKKVDINYNNTTTKISINLI